MAVMEKTLENAYMIKHLERFCALGYQVLVGMSRKTAIGEMLGGAGPDQRLYGSVAAALLLSKMVQVLFGCKMLPLQKMPCKWRPA